MPVFIYRAKDGPGRTVEGEITAETYSAAVTGVDALGYSPVWVREKSAFAARPAFRRRRATRQDVTVFTRQLASLTRSHVPILRALATIGSQTESEELERVVRDLEHHVRDGKLLSEALGRHPRHFSELYVNMVRSGEWGGVLDTILRRLAEAREQEDDTRRKVQAAMAYPALVLVVGAATVFVLLAFFMPRVVELFKDFRDLPLPTRALMAATDFCSGYWHWLLFAGLLAVAVLRRVISFEAGRMMMDRLKLRVPLMKRFVLAADVARFARTLALLLEAGVAIEKALELSAETMRNRLLRNEIRYARRSAVQQGMPLSEGLRQSRCFPPFVANMTAVGEEAGQLETSLNEVALFYEKEVDQQSRVVTSLIEPALILLVGGVVGFIVAAMLLPIFRMGGGIR